MRYPLYYTHNWSESWQNQQNDCVPSEDSNQPARAAAQSDQSLGSALNG